MHHEVHFCVPRQQPYAISGAPMQYATDIEYTGTMLFSIRPIWIDCRITNHENRSSFPECFLRTSSTSVVHLLLSNQFFIVEPRLTAMPLMPPSPSLLRPLYSCPRAKLSQSILKNPFNIVTPLIQLDLIKKKGLWLFELSLWNFFDQTFPHFSARKWGDTWGYSSSVNLCFLTHITQTNINWCEAKLKLRRGWESLPRVE